MQHMILKAHAETVTDLGQFEAVISTSSVDREGDVVVPAAMVAALRAWTTTAKLIPFHWNHSTDPEDIVGHIDPASVFESGGEVMASGKVDLESSRGKEIWRLVKSNTLGFSFGYMVTSSTPRGDRGRTIHSLDVFEVSATPTPMNQQTRVVGWKSDDTRELAAERRAITGAMDEADAGRALKRKANAIAAECSKDVAPVQVASFDC